MRRMKTKVSALLVALCMLASMLPAIPVATAEAAGEDLATIELAFNATNVTSGIFGNAKIDEKGWELSQDGTYGTITTTGDFYSLLKNGTTKGNVADNSGSAKFGGFSNINVKNVDDTVAFNFKVTKSAYYDINAYYYHVSGFGGKFEVYVDGKNLGEMDLNTYTTKANSMDNEVKLSGIYLDVGTHMIKFKCIGSSCSDTSRRYLYLNGIVFTENTAPKAKTETFTFNKTLAKVYDETTEAYEAISYDTATIANNGWEIDSSTNNTAYGSSELQSGYAYMQMQNKGDVFAFNFVVDAANWYNISMDIADVSTSFGGIGYVFIDGRNVGKVNWEDESGVISLESAQLTAGEHTLTIKAINGGYSANRGRMYKILKTLTLTPAEKIPETRVINFDSYAGSDTITGATIDNAGWKLNTALTTDALDGESGKLSASGAFDATRLYVEYTGLNQVLAVDFDVPATGDYDLSATMLDLRDFGGIFDIEVGTEGNYTNVGRVYNDPNVGESGAGVTVVKGLKNVNLTEGVNTLKITSCDKDRTDYGRLYMGLISLTLTPAVGDEADELVLDVAKTSLKAGETAAVTAKVVYADGTEVEGDIDIVTFGIGNPAAAASASYANGNITADTVGVAVIEATATVDGEQYKACKTVTVVSDAGEIPSNNIFGSKYAYIKQEGSTYTVTFVGGLNEIDGYAQVGFEVWIDGEKQENDIYTNQVYENISVGGTSYTASSYGGDYIFVATQTGLTAGKTIEVKPYIADKKGNKTYHGDSFTLKLYI